MAASTLITDYLGKGLAASRPASPPVSAAAIALFYATDTAVWSAWNGTIWVNLDVSLIINQAGTLIDGAATLLNFTGAGVTVTDASAGDVTINIPGGVTSINVGTVALTGGVTLAAGSNVALSNAGSVVTVAAEPASALMVGTVLNTGTVTLAAGTGIGLTATGSTVTIANTATATALTVQMAGSVIDAAATVLNFTGSGVTVTDASAGNVTIDVPGGAASGVSSINVGTVALTGAVALVAGSNVAISNSGSAVTIAATGGGGGSSTLAGLTDVAEASPASGQVLSYNGSKWANEVPQLGAAAATFNPSDKDAGITLSNGDLTATMTLNDFAFHGVRSISSASSGRVYFECVLTTPGSTGNWAVGLANAAESLNNFPGNDTNGFGYIPAAGFVFLNSTNVHTVATTSTAGDVICFAVDLTSKLLWIGLNGTNWNNSGTADPATGTGGVSLAALAAGPYFADFSAQDQNSAATIALTPAAFAFAPPAGFAALGGPSVVTPADVSVSSPIGGQVLTYDATAAKWTNRAPAVAEAPADGKFYYRSNGAWTLGPQDISLYVPGVLDPSDRLARYVFARPVKLPAGLPGAVGIAGVAATGASVLPLKDKTGTQIGTVSFATSGTAPTFALAADATFAAGDYLDLWPPSSPDATLADISLTFVGLRV